jgi:YbbR domain-containing protein
MIMQNRMKRHHLKFVSVLISFVVWIYVLNSEKIQFEKVVALDYILPEGRVFSVHPSEEVTFTIKGIRAFSRSVKEKKDRIVIDLNRLEPDPEGQLRVDLNPSMLKLPYGMRTEKISPKEIVFKLDKKERKRLPLKLQFSGELPENLILTNPKVIPSELEVSGPQSILSNLTEIPLSPVELSSLPGKNETGVSLFFPDERITYSGENGLKLNYQIKAHVSNFTLDDHPIRFMSHEKNIHSEVKTVRVSLFVPDKVTKNRLNVSSSVEVWAEIPQKAQGRMVIPLRVILPPSLHLLEISPKTIIVNVE